MNPVDSIVYPLNNCALGDREFQKCVGLAFKKKIEAMYSISDNSSVTFF